MISVLAVDDEIPALNELQFLLGQDKRVGEIITARTGTAALKLLQERPVDLVLLDIHMPGLTGLELAGVLKRFATPPTLIFVTADASHAVQAYDLAAVDYLLKPIRTERLSEAVGRVVEALEARGRHETTPSAVGQGTPHNGAGTAQAEPENLLVTQGDTTVRIRLREITHVTAAGDYARLHTARGSYLERVSLADLEERWQTQGFIRVHRSALVRLSAIESASKTNGVMMIRVAGDDLPVARRALPRVREALGNLTLGAKR